MNSARALALALFSTLILFAAPAIASIGNGEIALQDFTDSTIGFIAIGIFVLAYILVIGEEFLHLRKSKP
ncbi:MAG: sodium:proton antiporter, partial [Gammaproteobacteria bacterium]|nr:sodium:proton antiporter [Gammaproteobacteria bacterium]